MNDGVVTSASENRGARLVRTVIYSHVAANIASLMLSLADRHRFDRWFVELLMNYGGFLFLPALLAWVVCPIVLLIAIFRGRVSGRTARIGVLAEVLLCGAQWHLMLPMVM